MPDQLTEIRGGYRVKQLPDGRDVCVMRMMFNWRLVVGTGDTTYDHGWCYFGHGDGKDMGQAFLSAYLAALAWDGDGEPEGYDKKAF